MSMTLLCSAGYLPSLSAAGKGDNNHNGYPSRTILPESRKTASSVMGPTTLCVTILGWFSM